MNKQLILDNKECFDHWLNGGKLLAINTRVKEWVDVNSEDHWAVHDTHGNVKFIINDEYAELRKALAEGKTIEKNYGSMGFGCPNKWDDFSTKFGVKFKYDVECYRVKPEEPEFPCFYREKSSGIIVKFPKQSNRNYYSLKRELGIVVKGTDTAQKTLGFEWRCWDTFCNPDRWEHLENYIEEPEFKVGDFVVVPAYGIQKISWIEGNFFSFHGDTSRYGTGNLKLWQPQEGEWCWFNHGYHINPTLIKYTNQDISKCEPFIGDLPQSLQH